MDEVLVEGWRDHLEQAYADGVTRPRYQYTWSWINGKPGLVYGGDKIHSRHGYEWKHPVHEVITAKNGFVERQGWYGLEIHHHPDSTKSRGQYLPLLELSVEEDPDDDRNAHYYARELYFAGRLPEAKAEFLRHLNLPLAVWKPERAASMRYLAKCDPLNAWWWLESATLECPERREAWVDMAQLDYDNEEWQDCLWAATRALQITERPLEYLCEDRAWGPLPHDLAAIAAFKLGYYHQAQFHGSEAVKLSPYEDRLVENLRFYRKAAA
jgi:tetratricopeptide (TPR) repeat protein